MENMEKIGEICITSGEVIVIDPGYSRYNNYIASCKVDMRNGLYDAYISRDSKGDIANLCIVIDGTDINDACYGDYEIGSASVDSGTCGIFDNVYHREIHSDTNVHDEWYDKFVVTDCPETNITDDKGVLSSSGKSDGCFPVFWVTDSHGNKLGICVEYIYEGWEDED